MTTSTHLSKDIRFYENGWAEALDISYGYITIKISIVKTEIYDHRNIAKLQIVSELKKNVVLHNLKYKNCEGGLFYSRKQTAMKDCLKGTHVSQA